MPPGARSRCDERQPRPRRPGADSRRTARRAATANRVARGGRGHTGTPGTAAPQRGALRDAPACPGGEVGGSRAPRGCCRWTRFQPSGILPSYLLFIYLFFKQSGSAGSWVSLRTQVKGDTRSPPKGPQPAHVWAGEGRDRPRRTRYHGQQPPPGLKARPGETEALPQLQPHSCPAQ